MKRNHLLLLTSLLLQIVPVATFADTHINGDTKNPTVIEAQPVSHADVYINGIYYNLYDNTKEAVVTGCDIPTPTTYWQTINMGYITIPSTVNYEGATYTVTSIKENAFAQNDQIISITLPNSLTSIGNNAFEECKYLQSITIPKSVTNIGQSPLSGCSGLISITVDKDNKIYNSGNNCNAIIHTETNELIQGCQNTVIPNTVTRIGNGAFKGMSSLYSIDIPNSVTSIGNEAFVECRGLSTLTIPNSVIYLGEFVFCNAENLRSITLSESLKNIQTGTFTACMNLESITIPASVESIEWEAFEACYRLESMYFESTTPPMVNTDMDDIAKHFFSEQFNGFAIHVPVGYKDGYMNMNNEVWKNATIIDDVVVPQTTTGITNIPSSIIKHSSPIFDLTGKRLTEAQKGINIINGKKVIIK